MGLAEELAARTREDLLGAQVPRLAAEWQLTGPDLPWRVLDGSLVFADISGFTALSERLARQGPIGAEELTDVLGQCFAELLAVAYAGGGSLLKFGGDALLLLFEGTGHAQRGVDAALGMRSTMRRVGQLTTSVGQVRLRMSLGVHSGDIHAFLVGDSHHELLLVGPGPSTVATMEGTADAGEIVVSPATASRIDARLLADAKGPGVLLRPRAAAPMADGSAFPLRLAGGDVARAVPVALREHLLAGGGDSEHRHASIAFVHFDGTDALLAEHGPAWMAEALHHLIRDAQAAAESHGVTFLGTDLDHDGGKIILVAGVPRTLGDDEGRLLRAVHDLAAKASTRAIPIRIGVNRGPVFAGEVGPPYRRTFTVMGDAVNLAARLMAKAERSQVLASAGVLERSRTAFATQALPPFFVKGKSKPVQAYAVGEAAGTQETRRSSRLPLTGRARESAALVDAWTAAVAGTGRVVVIEGDVGVGKSRLVEELHEQLMGADVEQRLVHCEQYEANTPFFAIRLLVGAVLGGIDEIERRVADVAPTLADWAPLIGDVLGVTVPDNEYTRHLEPRFRRARTNAVVAEVLTAAVRGPAVLVFEDVHWMDDASAAAVAELARVAARRPWLVVLTRRAEEGGLQTGDLDGIAPGGLLPVSLTALEPDATEALILAATSEAPLRPERRRAIAERSGGNPLFVEELLALAGHSEDELPESLEAIVGLQLDRLGASDGRLLRVAAVLGSSFDPALLAEVLGESAHLAVDGPLADYLVAETDGRLRFRHRLLRDVAYGLLPYRRRQELHGRAVDAIEESLADPNERAEVLSFHAFHARRYDDSLRFGRVAADRARQKFALVEARELYERSLLAEQRATQGLAARDRAAMWRRLGNVRQLLGDYAAADDAYGRVRRIRTAHPIELARMAYRHSEIAERQGRPVASARWIARGLRSIEGINTSAARVERSSLFVRQSGLRAQLGHLSDALRWAQRAVAEAEASRGREARAMAYAMLDVVHVALGKPEQATNGAKALALFRQLQKYDSLGAHLNNLGVQAYYEGRWSEALTLYDEARASFEKIGNVVDAALGRSNIAEIFADQGRLDEAEALLQEVIATWRSMSFPLGTARATRFLARVHLRRGDAEAALGAFNDARRTFVEHGLVGNVHEVDVWRAECLVRAGRHDEATALLVEVLAHEVAAGSFEWRSTIHRLRAGVAAAAGDLEEAWAETDESLHLARTRGSSYDVALALETLAVLARLGGRPHDEDARQERDSLLLGLGVVAPPPPPLPASAA